MRAVWLLVVAFLVAGVAGCGKPGVKVGDEAKNKVIFDNQSGKQALVKLIGPTSKEVEITNGMKQTVEVSPGCYVLRVRGGVPGAYTYSEFDAFGIEKSPKVASQIIIVLHSDSLRESVSDSSGVRAISEKEFEAIGKGDEGSGKCAAMPASLQKRAAQVFADGKLYYVWSDAKGRVKCPGRPYDYFRALVLDFNFATEGGGGKKFVPSLAIEVVDSQSGQMKRLVTTITPHEGLPNGRASAIFVVEPGRQLEGTGKAFISLLLFSDKESEQVVISNEIVVDVEF